MSSDAGARKLPPVIAAQLDGYRRRDRVLTVARGAALTVCVYLGLVVVLCLLDRFVLMPTWLRAALSAASFCGVAACAWLFLLRPVRRGGSLRETALSMEAAHHAFEEGLATTVDHLAGPGMQGIASPALVGEVAGRSAEVAAGVDLRRLLPFERAKRFVVGAAAAACVLAVLFAVPGLDFARLFARFHLPLANIGRASSLRLEVEPGSVIIGTGDGVTITATAAGRPEGPVVLRLRPRGSAWSRTEMPGSEAPSDGPTSRLARRQSSAVEGGLAFVYAIESVTSSFDYYVTADDAESAVYTVTAVDRPLPELFRITRRPPGYTGARPVTVEQQTGAIEALKGSSVRLEVVPSRRLIEARMVTEENELPMAVAEGGMLASREFPVEGDGEYSLVLVGEHRIGEKHANTYPIRALPDRPPSVRAELAGPARAAEPGGVLFIRYKVSDDWGVKDVHSQVRLNAGRPVVSELPVRGAGRSVAGEIAVDLRKLGATDGDHVSIGLVARDALDQAGMSVPIDIWLGHDQASRRAAERADRVASAAKRAERLRELEKEAAELRRETADLLEKPGWSAEGERKLAELRRLERELARHAESARRELEEAKRLAADDRLRRALATAARRLMRKEMESGRIEESLAELDAEIARARRDAAFELERAAGKAPRDLNLADRLGDIAAGERARSAVEREEALAERKAKLEEMKEGAPSPAQEVFLEREEEMIKWHELQLARNIEELGLDGAKEDWKDEAEAIIARGEDAADKLAREGRLAPELAALAEEARRLTAEPEAPAERGIEAIRADLDAVEAELARAARDEGELARPDYAAARDDDLARAALEGVERDALGHEETNEEMNEGPPADFKKAARRAAADLAEAAEALEALENAAEARREPALEEPDRAELEAREREAEAARDVLARLAGRPEETLQRLAERQSEVADQAAEAARRDELPELARTQEHLAEEAERLAERLVHEANAATAEPQPDVERIAELDALREGLEGLAQEKMEPAALALERAAEAAEPVVEPGSQPGEVGPPEPGQPGMEAAGAEQRAAELTREAAEGLAELADAARRMADERAAAEALGDQEGPLAELAKLADLEQAQRDLMEKTGAQEPGEGAAEPALAEEQEALADRSREVLDGLDAAGSRAEALSEAAAAAARQAQALAETADELAQDLRRGSSPESGLPRASEVAEGARDLAQEAARAETAAQASAPQAAAPLAAGREAATEAAGAAEEAAQAMQTGTAAPAAENLSEASLALEEAAEALQAAAALASRTAAALPEAGVERAADEQSRAAEALASEAQGSQEQALAHQASALREIAEAQQGLAQAINTARTESFAAAESPSAPAGQAPSAATPSEQEGGGGGGGRRLVPEGEVASTPDRQPEDGTEWGRLREGEDPSTYAEREGYSLDYADSIRLYFEAVAREGRRE